MMLTIFLDDNPHAIILSDRDDDGTREVLGDPGGDDLRTLEGAVVSGVEVEILRWGPSVVEDARHAGAYRAAFLFRRVDGAVLR